ncbi:MAG: hypothetical protein GC204_05320 [Chloroflexi bacterium]|nr:hypothetical protein [Chloroflexota bacterium]
MDIADQAARLGISLTPGVSVAALDAFEADFGFPLTADLRSLYQASDGLVLSKGRLRIPALDEIRSAWLPGFRFWDIPQFWGYFPLIDRFDSNPLCVCCASILTGYVVQVFHDDDAQVKFRSLDSLLATLLRDPDSWDLIDLPADMNQPFRSGQDIEIGRQLLARAQTLTGETQDDAIRFGIWLLSEAEVDEIIPFLDYPDQQVVYDVEARLKTMSEPRAWQALKRFNPKS